MFSGRCKKCGKQSLRLTDDLCFRCKFIQNKEDYIRRSAGVGVTEPMKDVSSDSPMENEAIIETGITEPSKKKKRVRRKKEKNS